MTVPNTPPGPGAESAPAHDPFAPPLPDLPKQPRTPLLPELRVGALTALCGAVLGVVLGLLWLWLAPQVGLVVKGDQLLYADPEGEQRAGADSVFALLGLGAGVLSAVVAFLLTRRRGGGIAVAVGLAVGGLAGSLIGWQLGVRFGPTSDLIGHARQVGDGGRFSAPLELGAHGALLVWPISAMVLLLVLSAAFGKREEDPPPYWAVLAAPAEAPPTGPVAGPLTEPAVEPTTAPGEDEPGR